MKSFVYAAGLIVALGVGGLLLAEDKPAAPATKPTTAPATTQAASAKPVNTKCPVSGDPIDAKAKTIVYQGKTIGFCCEDCVEPFQKNPEKYTKNMK